MHQKNRKTKALHEQQAVEWDKKTESLSFKLHPLTRREGQLRSHFPCGHHITFTSQPCHKAERKEMLERDLI